ncbi:hypothetical protein [Nocardia wallacei]|uniref:Secreted protein n=2 Tax=Nocardia wallacei TaxID=480035 RepID=A0A7G1KEJ6_9NOCA|nr:hypothetical protein [Nocardia wallacei]BCK53420.1 hypothetical protein NWFMUON74_11920 [Nocardia wallacei]
MSRTIPATTTPVRRTLVVALIAAAIGAPSAMAATAEAQPTRDDGFCIDENTRVHNGLRINDPTCIHDHSRFHNHDRFHLPPTHP